MFTFLQIYKILLIYTQFNILHQLMNIMKYRVHLKDMFINRRTLYKNEHKVGEANTTNMGLSKRHHHHRKAVISELLSQINRQREGV